MNTKTAQAATRFVRNFAIFFALLITCAGGLGYIIVQGQKDTDISKDWVIHTHNVIVAAEEFSTQLEALLSAQRGYLLTHAPEFQINYDQIKINALQNIDQIQILVKDNPSQSIRTEVLEAKFKAYATLLEDRVRYVASHARPGEVIALPPVSKVLEAREEIQRLTSHILREEHEMMNQRLEKMQDNRENYFTSLVLGGAVSLVLLLVLNSFLLHAQTKRTEAEHNLEITQERLNLAVRGARDGIFDWDLTTGQLYWSDEYKAMLGYTPDQLETSIDQFKKMLHPDDQAHLWEAYELYIGGSTSEFDHIFRMKHRSGRWIWISARGKAVFEDGKPVRFLGAHSDITHLKEAEFRLAEEKQKAEKANRAKTEFLAHMSHEIRTPLTAITGIAEILQRQLATLSERQQQLVNTLFSSTTSLRDLINDILDFSKIESGEIDLKEQEVSLREVFDHVISMMSVPASQKGLKFNFTFDEVADDVIICDEVRFRQILVNLIGNAIKFTEHGSVNVRATKHQTALGTCLRVDVTDTGIGIDPKDFDMIFERFKQVDQSVSRKYGGTGLGLAISQNLAQRMNGAITLESEQGKGSTFTLIIPMNLVTALQSQEEIEKASQKLADSIKMRIDGSKKILMAEDYEGNIVVLSYILEELGCEYDVAHTGAEAVKLWERNHYDLILMDIQMPEMDGFAATATIRQMEKDRKISPTPIVGMTAHALVGDKDKCIAAGMDAYLPKPIVEADLRNEILKQLNRSNKAA